MIWFLLLGVDYSLVLITFFLRFSLDIDLDAPKVRVPIRPHGSFQCDSHLLLDLGHFTLNTKVCHVPEAKLFLYYSQPISMYVLDIG